MNDYKNPEQVNTADIVCEDLVSSDEETITAAETVKKKSGISVVSIVLICMICFSIALFLPFILMQSANASEDAKMAEADTLAVIEEVVAETSDVPDTALTDDLLGNLVVDTTGVRSTDAIADAVLYETEAQIEEAVFGDSESSLEEAPLSEYSLGIHHSYVKDIQLRLMELNYMEDDSPTDYYGPMTSQAVTYFQRKNDLSMTGVADQTTLDVLFSDSAKKYVVSLGARGDDVSGIQERLCELGYMSSDTGYFGDETKAAVIAFQKNNGLTADGCVGNGTKEVLYSSGAKKASSVTSSATEKKKDTVTETTSPVQGNTEKSSENSKSSQTSNSASVSSGYELKGDSSGVSHSDSSKVEAFIAAAESLLGKPYVLGGKGPDTFDCSGFVYYALNQSGFSIGYMTSGGWAGCGYSTIYGMNNLERGDIVCYKGHVGIYLGGDSMIDASSTDGKIRKCYDISTKNYWKTHFICGKRPLL